MKSTNLINILKLNKIIKTVFFLSAVIAGSPVWAESWYQVEVIVFDYTRPDLDGELWFENPGLPLRDDAIDLLTAVPDPIRHVPYGINQPAAEPEAETSTTEDAQQNLVPYLALPEEKYRLSNDYRRLRLSSAYRPLLHVAWEQPGLDSSGVRQVHLERLTGDEITQSDAAAPEGDGTAAEHYIPPDPIFDGLVRLRSSSDLLYVDVDMAYFPNDFQGLLISQAGDTASDNNNRVNLHADYVRLTDSRRIRLNELNFFDHPLFGVLLQVSRIDSG